MPALLFATTNPGKIEEMRALLAFLPQPPLTLADLGLSLEVAETGSTYAENAALKATAFCRLTGLPTLADDSGLEVDALEGAPGLHSARLVPHPGATDAARRAALLAGLAAFPRPWVARFRCALALAMPGGLVLFAEGVCEGEIIPTARGAGGFGYDPVFWLPAAGCTMAELQLAEKNRLSHRARAVQAFTPRLLARLSA